MLSFSQTLVAFQLFEPNDELGRQSGIGLVLGAENAGEFARVVVEAGEDRFEILVPQMALDDFAQHVAKVGGESQSAPFIAVFPPQTRPETAHFATLDLAAQNEHVVAVAVTAAAIPVSTLVLA